MCWYAEGATQLSRTLSRHQNHETAPAGNHALEYHHSQDDWEHEWCEWDESKELLGEGSGVEIDEGGRQGSSRTSQRVLEGPAPSLEQERLQLSPSDEAKSPL